MKKYILVILLFYSQPTSQPFTKNFFIVWNVGQGLGTTWIDRKSCFHFDLGGDQVPIKKIRLFCQNKTNVVHLSHSDQDHISGLAQLPLITKKICLTHYPHTENRRKVHFFKRFQICKSNDLPSLLYSVLWTDNPNKNKSSNDSSRVVDLRLDKLSIINPGDSSKKMERLWAPRIKSLSSHRQVLILGHHGSQTSTSHELLQALPKLSMSIASARQSKYGHPHESVIRRLKIEKNIIPIRTEDWGNLIFTLRSQANK